MNPSSENKGGSLVWLALGVFLVGAHAWAASNPEGAWWGIHFLGYLPTGIRWGFLTLALLWVGIFLGTKWFPAWIARFEDLAQKPKAWLLLSVATGLIGSVCFYAFPIATDVYGDSWNMEKWHGDNREFQWKWVTGAFHPNIMVHKESLTIGFHRILSFWTGADIRTVYSVVANVAGGGVLFLWTLFLRHQEFAGLRLPLWLAGVFLGATGVFFGQAENYPLPMLLMTLFFMLAQRVAKGGGPVWLLWVLFLVLVRSHATLMVWTPGLVYLTWFRLKGHRPAAYWLPWILVVLGGATLYFVILKSHFWPDDLIKGRRDLFLPFTTGPNLGFNYTLFNSAHLTDLVNSVAQLAAAPVLMLVGAMLASRKTPRLRAWPGFLAQGTSLTLAFFFFLNPALSMPRDWDLFCLLGLTLLFFCAGYFSGRKWSAKTAQGLTLMALIAGTLAIPMHVT
ncbi:MAG: hypothetical protein HKN21_11320, partial [Candidatus Eisenbacteria bacterium]|nr:hypothetical protein [Candidatus Eisenbacteria bacterium]